MVGVSLVVALAVAVLVAVAWEGDLRTTFGMTLLVLAGLISLTGSSILSRGADADVQAMTGRAPDKEDSYSGAALAPVGVFLFVAVPLFVIGGLLYGSG